MSILIKGMEIPEEIDETLRIQIAKGIDGTHYARYWLGLGSIGEWHEMKELPPHGRLIDADKLFKWIKAECNPYGAPTIGYEDGLKVLDIIDRCSTIIEAEEADE